MPTTLLIRDETTTGQTTNELSLEIPAERISVRELLRSRVYQEVKDHNVKKAQQFVGLIQPTDAEAHLNGYKLRTPRQIDWKKQFEVALDGFRNNRILILIDDRQAEGLDEEFDVTSKTQVTFLKLVPLVGG